ncbi:MAG TPA: NUDIX hydrolase [Chloroflexi bacterium]|nr:NUDIX hydrolase [Chloroflexota bacterium]
MEFTTLKSDIIYRGRVFTLRKDEVRLPDGNTTSLDILEHNGGIAMIPLDAKGNIWFVRQYRQAAGQVLLEIPAGTLETTETPEENVHRELQEEIGMDARRVDLVGACFLAPGYSSEYMRIFLARDLFPASLQGDEDEFLEVVKVPFTEALEMIPQGAFQDAKTILGLLWVEMYLRREQNR